MERKRAEAFTSIKIATVQLYFPDFQDVKDSTRTFIAI